MLRIFTRLAEAWRRLRRAVSRGRSAVRLLGLSIRAPAPGSPGLVLVQIDGLSRQQFERAMRRRRMPFLRRLLRRQGYQLRTLYSGIPSMTPAFQAELFYGVRCAVPSFRFRDRATGRNMRMFDPGPAALVQSRLSTLGPGLLAGGSAYCDIFSGGADEPHFCPGTFRWDELWRSAHPVRMALFGLLYFDSVIRVARMMIIELVLALVDCARGLIDRRHLGKELGMIPSRVAVGVMLRELLTIGASIDVARGLPVIHLNYLGYDEHAHRRGPASAFAHWTLRGIDRAIRRVWRDARRSRQRDYQVWVYSDHGQEPTVAYADLTGKTASQAIAEVFQAEGRLEGSELLVTAMGSLGQVYCTPFPSPQDRDRMAEQLVAQAKIPLVLSSEGEGRALAWNARGCYRLPEQAELLLGRRHPFARRVAKDLVAVCHHPDAGQLVISGWSRDGMSVSFSHESGSHGGPSVHETRAMMLLPDGTAAAAECDGCLRPLDFRRAVMEWLHGGK